MDNRSSELEIFKLQSKEKVYNSAAALGMATGTLMSLGIFGSLLFPIFTSAQLELFPLLSFMGGALGSGLLSQWFSDRADALNAVHKDMARTAKLKAIR